MIAITAERFGELLDAEARLASWEDRMWATTYERTAWQHDIGEHDGYDLPVMFCPRCEIEHPKGRLAAAESRLAAVEAELQFKINAMRSWRYRAERAEYNLKAADARLAAVRALCERNFNLEDYYEIDANDVAAILEGRAPLAAVDGPADHIALFDGPPLRSAGSGAGGDHA